MTVACKPTPYLGDENTPHLCLCLPSSVVGFLLQIKHPLAHGHEVGDKMPKGRRMGLI